MGKTQFTEMQQAAIDVRDKNILVSAAAGSGKTSVLVERIIRRVVGCEDDDATAGAGAAAGERGAVSRGENAMAGGAGAAAGNGRKIDIDRILVMTFTRAAAAQMKEKILDAINKKRLQNPKDMNLNRQYALVHNASIMTIDSFCLSVVRNHFAEIDVAPDFRMADEGEMRLLKQDVLENVLEEMYESGDEDFLKMTEIFASNKTDVNIEKLVLSLYDYAESYPDPQLWLEGCSAEYAFTRCNCLSVEGEDDNESGISDNKNNPVGDDCVNNAGLSVYSNNTDEFKRVDDPEWLKIYVRKAKRDIDEAVRVLEEAMELCLAECGPAPYADNIEGDLNFVKSKFNFANYGELYNTCYESVDYEFSRLKRVTLPKEGTVSEEELILRMRLKDRVAGMRKKAKDTVTDIIKTVSKMSPDDIAYGMGLMEGPVKELSKLTLAFMKAFSERKREKNIVDFSDIEHMCLEILRKGKDTTAREYREFFEEIYVDEYQDSNFVQEEILNLIARNDDETGNVFMVGDVKQSIYGFRMAKPELFVGKYNRYSKYSANPVNRDVRIDLSHNFRSREEVLTSVNSIFGRIMDEGHGGIVYDDAAALHVGRTYADTGYDYRTELNLIVHDDELHDREAEALMVAGRIKELISTGKVDDNGVIRPVKYSDIVILLRTAKGWDTVFSEILESRGIPVFVTSSTGYFESMEIRTVLNLLKIIDNPLQDIPMAAVMMSVIGDFTEEETALIRGSFPEGYLYDALLHWSETYRNPAERNISIDNNNSENVKIDTNVNTVLDIDNTDIETENQTDTETQTDTENQTNTEKSNQVEINNSASREDYDYILTNKVRAFLNMLEYYRTKAEYTAVSDILTEIIDGDYGKIIKALPSGKKRYANLNMLLKKAYEYGETSYKGIFHFNRYIEAIRKYDIDYGEANLSDESDNTVRIMSIHKSKGLEFPVCFVCGMSKAFNFKDTTAAVLTDSEFGIATDIIDVNRRIKSKSLFHSVISGKKKDEIIAEEMRILYVAMTRAKEKLIMTGAVKDTTTIEDSLVTIDNAKSYLDMYICASDKGSVDGIDLNYYTTADLVDEAVEAEMRNEIDRNRVLSIILGDKDNTNKITDIIRDRFAFKYPHEDRGYVKLSVSELKHKSEMMTDDEASGDNNPTKRLYEFEPGQVNKAALHGTAVHRIFEIWDYDRDTDEASVKEFLDYVRKEGLIEDDLSELVRLDEITAFVNSDIALRMKAAHKNGTLRREQPFVISDNPEDPDSMLVQGIIDAYFEEEGKIILVDYKTDRGKNESELKAAHSEQLKYYGMALERMLHKELGESVIYSTFLKKSIII